MDPGPEKQQQGDQLEAHSVALPADGSPLLEEHQDDGKDFGKLWSNVDMSGNMVSGDHGEESRCSSPPQSVDCTNSSSGSSSQDDCSSSSVDSCFSRSSGSSTPISSEDEVGNEYTSSYGSISTTSCSPTVDRPYAELEMAEKLQEGICQWTSLGPTHGFYRREEPILRQDDSRLIGISHSHQVGLVGDVTSVPSVTGLNRKRTMESDSEDEPPAKKTRDAVEELSFKRTRDSGSEEEIPAKRSRNSDDEEELVVCPTTNTWCEDSVLSSPHLSPSPLPFWVDPIFSPIRLSPNSACEDPILPSPVFSPSPRLPCEGPIASIHSISPPVSKDPVLSSPVLSRPQRIVCEDPIVSSPVVCPSPSTYCRFQSSSFPCMCAWMKFQMDKEEEPVPSTSGIGSDRARGRVSSGQVWFRPHYDLSSDDSD